MSADLLAEFGGLSNSLGKENAEDNNTVSGKTNLLLDLGFSSEADPLEVSSEISQPQTTQKSITFVPSQVWGEPTPVEQPGSTYRLPLPQCRSTSSAATETSRALQYDQDLFRHEEDGSNVLFDASTENTWPEDDFGDFETGEVVPEKEAADGCPDFELSPKLEMAGYRTPKIDEGGYVPPKTKDLIEDVPSNARYPASHRHHDLDIGTKPVDHSTTQEPTIEQALSNVNETTETNSESGQVEDDWGDFMDAPAGDFEGDESSSYPPNLPTISTSPPPQPDLPSKQAQLNSEPTFGFVPMAGKKARPHLVELERPTSFASIAPSDGEESPGWDWKVSAGSKSPSKTESKSAALPSLLRPSLAKAQRPSSFSTVASSDGDRSPGWDWKTSAPPDPVEHIRPFNIPPPSLLLQLFPPIFERFQRRVFGETMSRSSDKLKDTALLELGREVAAVSRVVGHILAGRKPRWRRDTNLSQNMKIGPAQGKGGGMKLTGVDKSETTKEEREADDVLQTWRKYAGLFRSAVSSAGGTVVELSENMQIKTLGQPQGAFKAPHPCALCGLMRDERVAKVDGQEIQDSFGEWWTEHWGHLECRLFWEENQVTLSQRR